MRLPSILLLSLLLSVCSRLSAQNVRLTEFMAVNATGIKDEDGTVQGWIEIWNPNSAIAADVTGSKIEKMEYNAGTGQVTATGTWTFPSFQIMPDERVIIFASGKNRTVSTVPLHTNFTLPVGVVDPARTALVLRRSDNSLMSRINYPAQTADISYGRDEWDAAVTAALTGPYTNPSPGERNNYSGPGVTGNVVISEPSRAFTGTLSVTLSMALPDPDATIRYTVNGTVPIASSTAFSTVNPVPIAVNATQVIRARAFKTGFLPGETESAGYLLLDGTTSAFSSALPLTVITNFTGGTPPPAGDQIGFLWQWMPAAPDNRSRFTNAPVIAARVAMDRRGSSTLNNAKFNLNIEFRKARDDDDLDVTLMGMPMGSDWVFGAPFDFDRSLIHNPLAYELSNRIGRYATRTRMAEVFVDVGGGALNWAGANAGDYFGVYNVTEKIRRDDDRVDIERLDPYDNDAVNKTGGYIFKIDRRDDGDTGFAAGGYPIGNGSAGPWGTCYYYPNETLMKSPQRDPQRLYLTSAINTFYAALQSATWNNPVTGYAAYLDVPEAVDHHVVNVWTNNLDAFRLSGYWHKHRGGKLIPGPVWDFDRSIDCSSDTRDDVPTNWRGGGDGTDFFNYTWWNRLFQDIDFYQKLIDRWQVLRRGPFSQAAVEALVDQLNAQIGTEAVNRDLARWVMTKRQWTRPALFGGNTIAASQAAEIQRIKDYLQVRANFMDSQWVGPVTASVPEGQITPGATVTLTGPASSVIYYTLNGADPRPAGGGGTVAGGVLTYSSPITINSTTRLRARAYKAAHTALTGANNPPLVSKWGGLTNILYTTDTLAAAGNLVITEINYHPANPTPAELAVNPFLGDNDFEFIELRNISEGTVNLSGCQFTLGVTWSFTGENAVSIPAGGHLILCGNPAGFAARYGAGGLVLGPFTGSLSNGGETLRLVTANNSLIQEITYSDLWAPDSDGAGKSLAVYNPHAAAAGYGEAANWRASQAANGSPGAVEPNLAPEITAGAQYTGTVTGISLPGAVTDDGQPENPGAVSVGWSVVSGPGTAQFTPQNAAGTTVAFSLPGAYLIRLGATDGSLTSDRDITVLAHDTLAAWQARHPGAGAGTGDYDGDDLPDLTEFALLTDPGHSDAAGAFTSTSEAGGIAVSFRRQSSSSAPSVSVQTSDTLQNFQPLAPGTYTQTILSDDGVTQSVKVLIHHSAAPRVFIRLLITGP